ncbi:hypothetical protein GE061_008176 [Apolygus lucorum]|uniref:Uncharacterized protein n=1 Tax=Apolygus lucorum TaxID=248454 RepID=A0A6A4J2S4_APOLU|nr:hypothetical protein GE061_008176 [Apolygus lucorum]
MDSDNTRQSQDDAQTEVQAMQGLEREGGRQTATRQPTASDPPPGPSGQQAAPPDTQATAAAAAALLRAIVDTQVREELRRLASEHRPPPPGRRRANRRRQRAGRRGLPYYIEALRAYPEMLRARPRAPRGRRRGGQLEKLNDKKVSTFPEQKRLKDLPINTYFRVVWPQHETFGDSLLATIQSPRSDQLINIYLPKRYSRELGDDVVKMANCPDTSLMFKITKHANNTSYLKFTWDETLLQNAQSLFSDEE